MNSKSALACPEGLLRQYILPLLLTLVCGAVLASIHPAGAVEAVSGQGVYAALIDADHSAGRSGQAGDDVSALTDFARTIADRPASPGPNKTGDPHRASDEPVFSALGEFARSVRADRPAANRLKLAEADNALDALKEFLKGNEAQPAAPEAEPPKSGASQPPKSSGKMPARPKHDTVPVETRFGEASFVGERVCLTCHAGHAEEFSKTLMGRIGKTQPGKFACENCHGPGSVHLKAGGCAACHGEGGITRRAGIPSLAGQDSRYLGPAMKAYMNGQRKSELMRLILSGVSEAELNNIAQYYAGQAPARAQTPPVGDPAAGRASVALCANCHGEQGVSVYPAWPSLAGQDAQYLALAIRAYKDGSRSKAVTCAGCHGDNGISKRAGIPSLVGLDPKYLVVAMKAYTGGQRKHDLMKIMLSGVSETELGRIALHYAKQVPARAQTPSVGDIEAGKTVSAKCAGCHGAQGVSANAMFPSLAGQDARYLANAIRAYKDGSHDNATMRAMVTALDDRAIDDVAGYYAGLAPAQPNLTSEEKNTAPTPDPVVVRNGLVASLDERTINNIASYFASLRAVQPARTASARQEPALVGQAPHPGGRSLGAIVSFRSNDPGRATEDNNGICLGCHEKGDRTYWRGSTHETRAVACTDCHTIMKTVSPKFQLKTVAEADTCFQCHKDRRAQMARSSHMPLREGKMTCSSCHQPHGTSTEGLLREASINDTCYKCHAEKRGPFLFEHTPVRDNCLNCHDAHGSINEYLLKVSRPRLCAECHGFGHGLTSGPAAVFTLGRSCQNCHTKVHGSNSPSGGMLQR